MDDKRPECQYGSLCYQKNAEHHSKYKHSFKRKESGTKIENSFNKKAKLRPSDDFNDKRKQSKSPAKDTKTDTFQNDETERIKESKKETSTLSRFSFKKDDTAFKLKNPVVQKTSISPNKRNVDTEIIVNREMKDDSDKFEEDSKKPNNSSSCTDENIGDTSKHDQSSISTDDHTEASLSTTSLEVPLLGKLSMKSEDEMKKMVKDKYLVQMPDDFFQFWHLCKKISSRSPKDAFQSVGLKLVGPFDILNGEWVEELMVTHWRFFYDPPEFQTIIISKAEKGLHYGYFRDSPEDSPVFIACNSNKDCKITPVASNLFMFLEKQLNDKMKSSEPFSRTKLNFFQQSLHDFCKTHNISLDTPKLGSVVSTRKRKVVCSGLSGVGLVVPYEKKTELGYRPLQKTNKELITIFNQYKDSSATIDGKRLLKSEIESVANWVSIALDECDFGTGLELGLTLFASGIEDFHAICRRFLCSSYSLLKRNEFATIIKAHLDNRHRDHVNLLQTIC